MKCLLSHVVSDEMDMFDIVRRDLLTIDDSRALLYGDDTAIDALMAVIIDELAHAGDDSPVMPAIRDRLRSGIACSRCSLPAEGMTISLAGDDTRAEHHIQITCFTHDGTPEMRFLSLDDSEDLPLDEDHFIVTPEFAGQGWRSDTGAPGEGGAPQDFLHTGESALVGVIDAMLDDNASMQNDALETPAFFVACLLLSRAGIGFAPGGDARNPIAEPSGAEEIIRGGRLALDFFMKGYLIGNRSWNPERTLPGPRLAEARAAAAPGPREAGRRAWSAVADLDDRSAGRLLAPLCRETRQSAILESILSVWVGRGHPCHPPSNHENITDRRRLDRLFELADSLRSDISGPEERLRA